MENLCRARQVRGAHRSVATKLENEARKILEKAEIMSDTESAGLEAITGLLATKNLGTQRTRLPQFKSNEINT